MSWTQRGCDMPAGSARFEADMTQSNSLSAREPAVTTKVWTSTAQQENLFLLRPSSYWWKHAGIELPSTFRFYNWTWILDSQIVVQAAENSKAQMLRCVYMLYSYPLTGHIFEDTGWNVTGQLSIQLTGFSSLLQRCMMHFIIKVNKWLGSLPDRVIFNLVFHQPGEERNGPPGVAGDSISGGGEALQHCPNILASSHQNMTASSRHSFRCVFFYPQYKAFAHPLCSLCLMKLVAWFKQPGHLQSSCFGSGGHPPSIWKCGEPPSEAVANTAWMLDCGLLYW